MTFHNTRGGIYNLIYFLFKKFAMPIILDSSDQMVAITNETKEFMEHVYGIPGNKVEIIPLGVDTRLFRNDSIARKQIRLKYNIKSSEIVFIFVGKIIPAKGVHILVEAALKVMNDYQNVKVMFVGGSVKNYENFLRKIIDSSEFKDNFIFVSAVPNEELYKYYSVADIGVWPLQCSITMNEAMSCGLPIIISDESGVPEIMGKGNGLTYENGNIKDLANKMKTLMDTKLREAMASRARDFANIHDWKHIADRFLAVIGE
jgi:glycosyltransferase involved in cell wall biosynthesis